MSEASNPFDHSDLTPKDLEVVRAFHATDTFATLAPDPDAEASRAEPVQLAPALDAEDEMLMIFVAEVDEDITALRRALEQAELDERIDSQAFLTLQRVAHKIRGTAAAIGCDAMSAIAHYIEILIQHTRKGELILLSGLFALGNAVGALETTLYSVVTQGQENMQPLLDLEQYYTALDIHASASAGGENIYAGVDAINRVPTEAGHGFLSVDRQHLGQLIQHAEQLVEQETALEVARKQVEAALSELHAAQARLRRIEAFVATIPMNHIYAEYDEHQASSLVARILREAELGRRGHDKSHEARIRVAPHRQAEPLTSPFLAEAALWDEMELDRFSETNLLTHALSEAIADVSTATAQLQRALAQFDTLLKEHVAKARIVRADTLLLSTAPFSVLSQRVQKAVQKIAGKRDVQLEVTGEAVEIDQDILETLATPLIQAINTHVAEVLRSTEGALGSCHIRLQAHTMGSEVTIEMGFSLPISGGMLDMLQEFIQPLHGSITAQRNVTGGMDFRLRFSHAKGVAQGLLIRAGEQCVIVPFSQVKRIDYAQREAYDHYYTLNALLGFARLKEAIDISERPQGHSVPEGVQERNIPGRPQGQERTLLPYYGRVSKSCVLVLQADTPAMAQIAVQVDEVVGQIELVMKQPAAQLRRPGITGMAIDSAGNVLLVLDVPELIRQSRLRERDTSCSNVILSEAKNLSPGPAEILRFAQNDISPSLLQLPESSKPKILIADDSVTIRTTLHSTLSQKDYIILEARDGSEALELLTEESPDLLLLDLEMPNINGYEVLNILRTRGTLPQLKVILLTSRTSDKHKRRARELGVHTYLTKPCPDDELLDTVASLIGEKRAN